MGLVLEGVSKNREVRPVDKDLAICLLEAGVEPTEAIRSLTCAAEGEGHKLVVAAARESLSPFTHMHI